MKALIVASAIVLASTSLFAKEAKPNGESLTVVSSKYKNLFVFKAKKKFSGATVEIFSSNGEMVTSQQLQKRKMIINFCDVRYDTYTIRIAKGNETQEFQYVKK
ncbi:MAG TPA: hypothetical protein PLJ60_01230 [Chryseolinea sp.]|nr:hypothetical protein [Chryseolinea sp.]